MCVCPDPSGLGNPLNLPRAWDRGLKFFPVNEEFPVSASHQLALITSLPFVHTARRYDRLFQLMSDMDESRDRLVRDRWAEKLDKLSGVEDVKVVTRYP